MRASSAVPDTAGQHGLWCVFFTCLPAELYAVRADGASTATVPAQ